MAKFYVEDEYAINLKSVAAVYPSELIRYAYIIEFKPKKCAETYISVPDHIGEGVLEALKEI